MLAKRKSLAVTVVRDAVLRRVVHEEADAEGVAVVVSRNRLSRVAAFAAALVASLGAFAASAQADATNRNSCRYSYDDYWRDMDVTFGGTPSVTSAAPGETIALNGLQVSAALPAWLAQYGYNFGLLQSGENEIPVTVWVGVRGHQHDRGRAGLRGRDDRAHDDHDVGRRVRSRRRRSQYDIPPLGATQWTARGGPVAFSQAASGALPELPVGPGGRLQKPRGSVYIQASLGHGHARPGLRARDVLRRGRGAPGGGAGAVRRRRGARVLVPRRGAGVDQRRAGQRRPRAAPRARSGRRGHAVRLCACRSRTGSRPRTSRALRDAGLLVEGDNAVSRDVDRGGRRRDRGPPGPRRGRRGR